MKRTKNPAKEAEYRKRAADLVAQMTLHEKVSQMLPRSSVWASPLTTGGARASTVSAARALPPSSPRPSAWPPPLTRT
jgi:hypothetical protein